MAKRISEQIINSRLATEILLEYYGITAICKPLVGYEEYNFHVKTDNSNQFVLKVTDADLDQEQLSFQQNLFEHLARKGIVAPSFHKTKTGQLYAKTSVQGSDIFAKLLTWIDGKPLENLDCRPSFLCHSLGILTAKNTQALSDFEHSYAHRNFEWNSDSITWVKDNIELFSAENRELVEGFLKIYDDKSQLITRLSKSIIHNDINECNVLYENVNYRPVATALIDYGDVIYSSRINNLAIALSYAFQFEDDIIAVLQHMLEGYLEHIDITNDEISCLYVLIAIRSCISLTAAAIAKKIDPDNVYTQHSVEASWKVLHELERHGEVYFTEASRAFAQKDSPLYSNFTTWIKDNTIQFAELFEDCDKKEIFQLSLGLESPYVPHPDHPYYEEEFGIIVNRLQREFPTKYLLGGYGEVRNFYTTDNYRQSSIEGDQYRTKHLGLDVLLDAGTELKAPYDSKVVYVLQNDRHKDYGVSVILEHVAADHKFYTLYGHLDNRTYAELKQGADLKKGEVFARIGDYFENGHWIPHLHFQVILDLLKFDGDFNGVVRPDHWSFMSRICPDPSLLFAELAATEVENDLDLLADRQESIGYGLSLSYEKPIHIIRGAGVHLIDANGQKYLDTVNNVAHVGHENYHIVDAATKQISILNTNTRYLSKHIVKYAQELAALFPSELSVVHFTNSGSEANELALRMAKTFTKRDDILAIEHGYHGNTAGTIGISSYKFDAKGGAGKPANTHILELPDCLRGRYSGKPEEVAPFYIRDAKKQIEQLKGSNNQLAAFIHESILSCGGQIVLPPGYLREIYAAVRSSGGVAIADEVQVGFGRVGEKLWAFELQDVVPDIVVMGKPIGNGHPLGAVICTAEIAKAFNNGMEYFNTFGGNPVSAITGLAVLHEIKEGDLQENAWLVGNYLKAKLRHLQKTYPRISDIRGHGLFLGIEFLDSELQPLPELASIIVEMMRDRRILMSIDGPDHNVIKIKPPITFSMENADFLLLNFEEVLKIISA